ncbi:hypothetical protein AAMO2058_001248300 [Amorphochlora amoebiformis]
MPALWSVAKACFFGGLVGFMVRGYMSKEVEGKILGESKKSKEKIASKTEMYAKLAKRVEAFLSTSDDPVSVLLYIYIYIYIYIHILLLLLLSLLLLLLLLLCVHKYTHI